jgi:magnesium transporter
MRVTLDAILWEDALCGGERGVCPTADGRSNGFGRFAVILDAAVYADGRRIAHETLEEAFRGRREPNTFAAVAVREPSEEEIDSIAGELGLSKPRVENAIKRPPRATIQRYENLLIIWLASVRYSDPEEGARIGWICVLLGEGLLVALSFGEGVKELENVKQHVESEPERLWENPWHVLREILNEAFDNYDSAVENLDGDVSQAEREVFDGRAVASRRVHALTRVVIAMHEAIEPFSEALDRFLVDAHHEVREDLSQARRRVRRVGEKLEGFQNLLSSLLNVNLAMVGQKISAWGAILIVPTLIAGIFGMNFEGIWLKDHPYGFELMLVLMVAIGALLYYRFKRSGWL